METKDIPLTRETVTDYSTIPALGPVRLKLPEGEALCHDAVSLTQTICEDGNGQKFIMIIGIAEFGGHHFGSLSHMTPDQARSFAASLIGGADSIDGGGRTN